MDWTSYSKAANFNTNRQKPIFFISRFKKYESSWSNIYPAIGMGFNKWADDIFWSRT